MTAPVIHINGWPGSGKLTIARALAHLIQAQVLHNHLFLDAAGAVFHRGTEGHKRLRADVTCLLLDAARTLPGDVPIIVTNALADTPEDRKLLDPFLQLAADRQARMLHVVLDITLEENCRRLANPARAQHSKLTDPGYLKALRTEHQLLSPPGTHPLDVTQLDPTLAASHIRDLARP